MCKCTPRTRSAPPARTRVNFRTFLLGGLDLEVCLDRLLSATTKKGKKGRQPFLRKVHPDKILATPMPDIGSN